MAKQALICIDDETNILDTLKSELLDALGQDYLIEIAEGGEEAIELVEELLEDGYEIPLVICDYIMPDMKGDQVLERIHQLVPKTLKIMLTGQSPIEKISNTINNFNLYSYISKPWDSHEIKLTVKAAINSYCQQQNLG